MKENGTGISAVFVLFVVFLVLKLCKVINWNWWWVTSPLWITAGLAILGGIIASIYVALKSVKRNHLERRK